MVVMTRDRSQHLHRCLNSLVRQDTPHPFEVIVVDDGSIDGTRDVVAALSSRSPTVRYHYQPPTGIAAARNAGISLARASLVAFAADDYTFPPEYVETALAFFRDRPDAVCVRFRLRPSHSDLMSRVSHFRYEVDLRNSLNGHASRAHLGAKLAKVFRRLPEIGNQVTTAHRLEAAGAAVFRRTVFDQIGCFDERLVRGEDTELAARLRRAGFEVHFHPGLVIARAYERTLRSAVTKSRSMGHVAGQLEQQGVPGLTPGRVVRQLLRAIALPVWRSRQAPSLQAGLAYLPLLTALEIAYSMGVLQGHSLRPPQGIEPSARHPAKPMDPHG
jgi:GT2 family glycosyltransferase